jgi:hypothetical protein
MLLNLYTTTGCHLCEEALALAMRARHEGHSLEICEVEISESESLMAAYGVRIPVVRIEGQDAELGWPFSYEQLIEYLS